MWAPLPPDPPSAGWWTELSFNRWAAGVAAEVRAAEQAKRRRRQLRRRVERIDEQMVLAAGASDARRTLRRHGIPYERSARLGPIEHSAHAGARVLSVR
jgi:hypothetical protein